MNNLSTFVYWLHYTFYSILIILIPIYYWHQLWQLNPIAIAYLLWYIYDFNSCDHGSRPLPWIRNHSFWHYFVQHFPIRLIRKTELSSDRNYIFACHPHGIFSISCVHTFTTDACHFFKLFPNLTPFMATISQQFWIPFYRELLLALGYCSVKAKSIQHILRQSSKGQVIAIMIGGTSEALEIFQTDTLSLIVKKRRGFIRLALKNGASIVPVISFGENSIYNYLDINQSWFKYLQQFFKSTFGFPLILFYGKYFTIFPLKKPITIVVGDPILIDEKFAEPSEQQIDQIQERYIDGLHQLYQQYKHQFNHDNISLVIK